MLLCQLFAHEGLLMAHYIIVFLFLMQGSHDRTKTQKEQLFILIWMIQLYPMNNAY